MAPVRQRCPLLETPKNGQLISGRLVDCGDVRRHTKFPAGRSYNGIDVDTRVHRDQFELMGLGIGPEDAEVGDHDRWPPATVTVAALATAVRFDDALHRLLTDDTEDDA